MLTPVVDPRFLGALLFAYFLCAREYGDPVPAEKVHRTIVEEAGLDIDYGRFAKTVEALNNFVLADCYTITSFRVNGELYIAIYSCY